MLATAGDLMLFSIKRQEELTLFRYILLDPEKRADLRASHRLYTLYPLTIVLV